MAIICIPTFGIGHFLYLAAGKAPFFLDAERSAEAYFLANCRKMYVRLICSDLNTIRNAAYADDFQQCLNDNAVVLRDFERLTVEVSQMNDQTPRVAPALDVIADALHEVREGRRGQE